MVDLQWNRDFALEQAGEDEELLAELLALLCESSSGDLAKMKTGQEKGDAKLMGEMAHSIKGAAASLGVEALRDVAYGIEKAGRDNDLGAASSLVSSLERLISELSTLK
jgi:HPt (histidine-containing phosphotransfer) domain-containing protein